MHVIRSGSGRYQLRDRQGNQGAGLPAQKAEAAMLATVVVKQKGQREFDLNWRRVLGVFQLVIPVSTKQLLLASEERRLSILRWIKLSIPVDDRWYLVFKRYVDQMARRMGNMGGDPSTVIADPNGDWNGSIKGHGHDHDEGHDHDHDEADEKDHGERQRSFLGKIAGLIYDRFGDFEGFLLDTEDGERCFNSREEEMEELVQLAWTERTRCTVYAEIHALHRPIAVVLRGNVN